MRPLQVRSRSTDNVLGIGLNIFIEIYVTKDRLKQAKHPWQVVKGLVAALICYLQDRGWDTTHYDRWTKPGANGGDDFELNMHSSWFYIREELDRAPAAKINAARCPTEAGLVAMEANGKSSQSSHQNSTPNMAPRSHLHQSRR